VLMVGHCCGIIFPAICKVTNRNGNVAALKVEKNTPCHSARQDSCAMFQLFFAKHTTSLRFLMARH
ncbi:MAG: hypothetical protein K2H14_02965, partial [Muribaculaceae bacterium]|nr:hypothetical protein [Muribaculaceae bacterium]